MVFSVLLDRRGALAWDEHEAICDAVVDRDMMRARVLVEEHILSALVHYEQAVEAHDPLS
jgi:DNA-binding GntR family transcriptional regulator